jgi:hypothetical protein
MTKELVTVTAAAKKEEVNRPSFKIARQEECEPPRKLEYNPEQPIEDLCSAPPRNVNGSE